MTDSIIKIENLLKSFKPVTVLKGVNAEVQQGEVIGLLGLNGSGKTTLLETLLGFAIPDSGSVQLFGNQISGNMDDFTKARIGFVPQQDELLDVIKGQQYLDLIAKFYPGWNIALVERLSNEWDIPLNLNILKLSVGQRQKLSILCALGHEPDLIVLDEPVASLDPIARRMFLQELVEIADSRTRTILFSTHIVSDLERVASRVWLMRDGDIEIDEELDSLKEHTVRINLPPGKILEANKISGNLIHSYQNQGTQTLVFRNWSDQQLTELENIAAVSLTPEHLSLEDIFLEFLS